MGSSAVSFFVASVLTGALRLGAAARREEGSGLSAEEVEARAVARRLLDLVDGAGLDSKGSEEDSSVARRLRELRGAGMISMSESDSEAVEAGAREVEELLAEE